MCWRILPTNGSLYATACAVVPAIDLDLTQDATIDTDTGVSNLPALRCIRVLSTDDVCALVFRSLTLEASTVLSAHGTRPLALLAHAIDIRGRIDVASHRGGQRGAGSDPSGCNTPSSPTGGGGGGGGAFTGAGGRGGDQGGTTSTGGRPGLTISSSLLRGGCDGARGGDGSSPGGPGGAGGAGGGAVWIASDTGPLVIGSAAAINASGASGAGGTTTNHGGSGGGSGGYIVLQAPTISLDPAAQIYANGGHGGGGAQGSSPGQDGTDASGPSSGGGGGSGGMIITGARVGNGAPGYPLTPSNGDPGDPGLFGGGGGGGGGAGAILISSSTILTSPNLSPPPVHHTP